MLKIAVLSLADINNYGDAFFPLVAKSELLRRIPNAEIELITNTEYENGLYKTTAYSREYMEQFDAIILAGGELISPHDDGAFCETYGEGYYGKPSDIAHGWLDLKRPFKAWFSVGAHPVLFDYSEEVDTALLKLNYLSVRGTISKKVLERGFIINNDKIRVMPDLGWLFPRYIDNGPSFDPWSACGLNENQPYIVFQAIEDLDIENHASMIAQALTSFQNTTGIKVLLIPVMHTKKQWFENGALQKIYNASREITLLSERFNILETGAILKNAKFFLGCSLHGAITLLAYGKPVVSVRDPINTKLQDLHAARFRSVCFANSWNIFPSVLERLNHEAENKTDAKYAFMYAEYMRYRIDREFDNLAAQIKRHYSGEGV